MGLTSPFFLFLFLPVSLALFYGAGRMAGSRGALAMLFAVSLLYASTQGMSFLLLVAASALINLAIAQRAAHKRLITIGIIANISLLILFKYAEWLGWIPFIGSLSAQLAVLIPATISFLTFQRATSLLDAGKNSAMLSAKGGSLRYLAFVNFLPNLVMGPIAYLGEVLPQMAEGKFGRVKRINFAIGLTLLTIGLFKKVVIADPLGAQFVDPLFAKLEFAGYVRPGDAFLAIIGYFAQLYFDFSGYSDMALGIARLFGIRLPLNFNSPLRASGIIDFYRRWHITLTRVISRFLFTPLSVTGTRWAMARKMKGMRLKALSLWLPLMANFIVIGIWHGTTGTFILFGLIHGLWYIIETEIRSTKRWKKWKKENPVWLRHIVGMLLTLPLLMLTFALFRAPHLDAFGWLLSSLWGGWHLGFSSYSFGQWIGHAKQFALVYGIILLLPNVYELMRRYRPGIVTYDEASATLPWLRLVWRPTLWWALFVSVLGWKALMALPLAQPFAYGGF